MTIECIICYLIIIIIIAHSLYQKSSNTHHSASNEIIFSNPNPWNKKISKKDYDIYYITVLSKSYNNFNDWKKIIPGLEINKNELAIPAVMEADALSIAHLIISNFNNLITFNEIINKQLIDITIKKARTYELVRLKLKEQLLNQQDDIVEMTTTKEESPKTNIYEASSPTAYNGGGDNFSIY